MWQVLLSLYYSLSLSHFSWLPSLNHIQSPKQVYIFYIKISLEIRDKGPLIEHLALIYYIFLCLFMNIYNESFLSSLLMGCMEPLYYQIKRLINRERTEHAWRKRETTERGTRVCWVYFFILLFGRSAKQKNTYYLISV